MQLKIWENEPISIHSVELQGNENRPDKQQLKLSFGPYLVLDDGRFPADATFCWQLLGNKYGRGIRKKSEESISNESGYEGQNVFYIDYILNTKSQIYQVVYNDIQPLDSEKDKSDYTQLTKDIEHLQPIKKDRIAPRGIYLRDITMGEKIEGEGASKVYRATCKDYFGDDTYIFKENPTKRVNSEIEAFLSLCYQSVFGEDKTPTIYPVYNDNNEPVGSISKEIPEFISFHKKFPRTKEERKNCIEQSIGSIYAAKYFYAENDGNTGNLVYPAKKIDHGQSLCMETIKYAGGDPEARPVFSPDRESPKNRFPITQDDINNLPYLHYADPNSFVRIPGIRNNKKFTNDKYITFLKILLISKKSYEAMAQQTITRIETQKKYINVILERQRKLKEELLKNENFLKFISENKGNLERGLRQYFERHNQRFRENSPLRVDLKEATSSLEAIIHTVDENPLINAFHEHKNNTKKALIDAEEKLDIIKFKLGIFRELKGDDDYKKMIDGCFFFLKDLYKKVDLIQDQNELDKINNRIQFSIQHIDAAFQEITKGYNGNLPSILENLEKVHYVFYYWMIVSPIIAPLKRTAIQTLEVLQSNIDSIEQNPDAKQLGHALVTQLSKDVRQAKDLATIERLSHEIGLIVEHLENYKTTYKNMQVPDSNKQQLFDQFKTETATFQSELIQNSSQQKRYELVGKFIGALVGAVMGILFLAPLSLVGAAFSAGAAAAGAGVAVVAGGSVGAAVGARAGEYYARRYAFFKPRERKAVDFSESLHTQLEIAASALKPK